MIELRRRRHVVSWLGRPLAPNEAAVTALVVLATLLVINGLRQVPPVPNLLIAAAAGTVLRLYAWFKIAGGRR